MDTANIPKAFPYQSMEQLIFETKLHSCSFQFIFFSISYDQIWILFANLMLGWQIWTFLNTEWTGLLENVWIFNHRGSKGQIIPPKQVGHVLRDTLYNVHLHIYCSSEVVRNYALSHFIHALNSNKVKSCKRLRKRALKWLWGRIKKLPSTLKKCNLRTLSERRAKCCLDSSLKCLNYPRNRIEL